MARVVTVSLNPAIDESTSVDRVVPEDKLRCTQPVFEPGGGGVNVSRALARLGTESLALWTCGGAAGQQLHGLLSAAGLQHRGIPVSGLTRTNVVIFETSSTHQYRFGMPGPELGAEDLAVVLAACRGLSPAPEVVVLSGSLPPGAPADTYAQLAAALPPGARVVLDSSGAALQAGLGPRVHLVKPNLRELGLLAGRPLVDDADVVAVARGLTERGLAERVVVSLGAGGAVAVDADAAWEARAPTVPIRSKVGAGDSMVAGMVRALLAGAGLDEMLRWGVAAGAAAVMTDGSELCRRDDVERLLGQVRVRAALD
jgi:6-phosphofructokinase 2